MAIKFNNAEERRARIQAMRQRKEPPKREGLVWTEDEKQKVKDWYNDGIDISEIMLEVERSEDAIIQQLGQMGEIVRKPRNSSGRKLKGCLCSQCELQEECDRKRCLTEQK